MGMVAWAACPDLIFPGWVITIEHLVMELNGTMAADRQLMDDTVEKIAAAQPRMRVMSTEGFYPSSCMHWVIKN